MKKWDYSETVEVAIKGHVQSREEFEQALSASGGSQMPYRGIVHHPNGRMEWQWCKTLREAKQWVKYVIRNYRTFGKLE